MKTLHPDDEFSELEVKKEDYSGQNLSRMRVSSSQFAHTVFANTDLSYGILYSDTFNECNLTGTQFIKNTLEEVVFRDCKVELSSFMFSRLKNVTFKQCTFNEVDLRDTELENVSFDDCVLEEVDFNGAKVTKRLDIASSKLISLKGLIRLKGLVIDEEQLLALAPFMASELGFVVKGG